MKDMMPRRSALKMVLMFLLAVSLHGSVGALLPETTTPHMRKLRPSESAVKPSPFRVAAKDHIAISEIMYDTQGSQLPQWIELHNTSTRQVSLDGWKVIIENHPEDTTVLATTLTIPLSEQILAADQVLLLVTEQGHYKGALRSDGIVILKDRIGGTSGYRLLSETAFKVTLLPPATANSRIAASGDTAGNLGTTPIWELPQIDGNQRSSILRHYNHNDTAGTLPDGTTADSWELTSEKDSPDPSYYGHPSDHGTPGYRAEAPLPVALSTFRPAFVRATGAITITWTTESEVDTAGFYIKRSQQRAGGFKIINATPILGAGATNEKQSYTYTDTTAKPNVVYYYQLGCVSVAGIYQSLTPPTRLRGHHVKWIHRFETAPFWWKK